MRLFTYLTTLLVCVHFMVLTVCNPIDPNQLNTVSLDSPKTHIDSKAISISESSSNSKRKLFRGWIDRKIIYKAIDTMVKPLIEKRIESRIVEKKILILEHIPAIFKSSVVEVLNIKTNTPQIGACESMPNYQFKRICEIFLYPLEEYHSTVLKFLNEMIDNVLDLYKKRCLESVMQSIHREFGTSKSTSISSFSDTRLNRRGLRTQFKNKVGNIVDNILRDLVPVIHQIKIDLTDHIRVSLSDKWVEFFDKIIPRALTVPLPEHIEKRGIREFTTAVYAKLIEFRQSVYHKFESKVVEGLNKLEELILERIRLSIYESLAKILPENKSN